MTKIRTTQKFTTKKSTPQAKLETLRRKEARQHKRHDYGKVK